MVRVLMMLMLAGVLAGCSSVRDSRYLGQIFDPLCAPDGSVVYVQFTDSKGEYNKLRASRENCPWNKK